MPRKPRTDGKPKGTKRADLPHHEDRPGLASTRSVGEGWGGSVVELNKDILYEMAKTHASFDTLALIFGCSAQLLSDKEKEWRPVIDKGRAEAQKNLLTAQFATAIQDRNPTMQIWLGKQYLDQKDVSRSEHTGPDGRPIQAEMTTKAVAYIPENNRDTVRDDTASAPSPPGKADDATTTQAAAPKVERRILKKKGRSRG